MDKEIQKKLLKIFYEEAAEHAGLIDKGLIELEKNTSEEERLAIFESVYRESHSLKGAARSVSLEPVEKVCQEFENIISHYRAGNEKPPSEQLDQLHGAVDFLMQLCSENYIDDGSLSYIDEINKLKEILIQKKPEKDKSEEDKSEDEENRSPAKTKSLPSGKTVRIETKKLDSLLLQTEELISSKLSSRELYMKLKKMAGSISDNQRHAPDEDLFKWLKNISSQLKELESLAEQEFRFLENRLENLLNDMKEVLMLPIDHITALLPRMVRDLARDLNKKVEFNIEGSKLELDRRILEEIRDPLIHLIRNAVYHGIEAPDERKKLGKPEYGKIILSAKHCQGNKIEITLSDDGSGIPLKKVIQSAQKQGYISESQAQKITPEQAVRFIFESDVSTSEMITDISGRGLGMAIVREKIEKMDGSILVDSSPEMGTQFKLSLPLTLATYQGILFKVCNRCFVVPSSKTERVFLLNPKDVKTVEGKETVFYNKEPIALVHMKDIFNLNKDEVQHSNGILHSVIVLCSSTVRFGFVVDEIIGEQEFLIKDIGKQLVRVPNISGATIIGSGEVVPVLNVLDLLHNAASIPDIIVNSITDKLPSVSGKSNNHRNKVLIVEDSITSRTLLKNILDSSGYSVKTAVDGKDALMELRSEKYDLVVSDVDMPRMNGFELTEAIRRDKKLSRLPVVLVTSLESKEDRERGVDSGANAYLIKSNFDQSNLLEVVKRLIGVKKDG